MTSSFPPRFTRTVDLYGEPEFARLRASGAVVVGLGGVGAHAAVALARSGLGRLHLIDLDVITTSSLNRHPCAGPLDVGRGKADVLASFLAATCPDTAVTVAAARVTATTVEPLLPAEVRRAHGVLLDAIDSVADKVALLAHGACHGWASVCSLGAAGKRDGGLVRTGALGDSRGCPLGRVVRRGLRAAGVDPAGIDAVWSEEPPRGPVTAAPGAHLPDEPGITRRQPSNMMLPGMFGYALAALAIERLAAGSRA